MTFDPIEIAESKVILCMIAEEVEPKNKAVRRILSSAPDLLSQFTANRPETLHTLRLLAAKGREGRK